MLNKYYQVASGIVQTWNMWAVNALERRDRLHGAWRQNPEVLLLTWIRTGSYLSSFGSSPIGFHLGRRAASAHLSCCLRSSLLPRVTSITILLLHCISLITFPFAPRSHWAVSAYWSRELFSVFLFIPTTSGTVSCIEAHAPKRRIVDKE